jgi:hypothetical protein
MERISHPLLQLFRKVPNERQNDLVDLADRQEKAISMTL